MKTWRKLVPAVAVLLVAGHAVAQSTDEQQREMEMREAEYTEKLHEAEARMAAAARRVAELSVERMPEIRDIQMRMLKMDRPLIGITIDGKDDSGPVEGVEVIGVTPGTGADDAGLRAGDFITAVNGETMTADSSELANKLLFEIMSGVEEGDVLDIEYLRNGNSGSVELSPRKPEPHAYSFVPNAPNVFVERFVSPHKGGQNFNFDFRFPWASGWGSMELVELNEGLGRYFGTTEGLLVVSAPEPEDFGLEDGDVIQNIDGREPKDVRHALKILGSYDSGEKLELGIMREKKKRTIEVEIPANDYRGSLLDAAAGGTLRAHVDFGL